MVVANAGDSANVTFVLPTGPAAENIYMLQHGEWTEVTEHADIDNEASEVTVTLEDGGVGDADRSADGVIDDPVGVAGQNQTITARVVTSPASAQSFTFRLERCDNTDGDSGGVGSCTDTNPDVFETPDSQGISNGGSFTWGSLEYGRVYRLTSDLPAGWNLTDRGCDPDGGAVNTGDNAGSTGIIIRLDNQSSQRIADCTFEFSQPQPGTLTIRKAGDRLPTTRLRAPESPARTFSIWTNSTLTTPADPGHLWADRRERTVLRFDCGRHLLRE